MRPEETTKCEFCKWQGKWDMMLLCAPKTAWQSLIRYLEHQTEEDKGIVEVFIEEIHKNLKNYDKAGSKK